MIKPDEISQKIENLKNDYIELYEMFDYLDKSRDEYISKNLDLKNRLIMFKRLSICFFVCCVIEFILFLVSINV